MIDEIVAKNWEIISKRLNIKIEPLDNVTNKPSENNENKLGEGVPFERLRRITGYLVGTIDRWNDGKRAELEDREKHNVDDNNLDNDRSNH